MSENRRLSRVLQDQYLGQSRWPAQYFRQVALHIASLELEGRSIVKELCKFDILFDILSITI